MSTHRTGAPEAVNHSSVSQLLLDLEVQALKQWAWRNFDRVAGIDDPAAHREADYWLGKIEEIESATIPDVVIWWGRPRGKCDRTGEVGA